MLVGGGKDTIGSRGKMDRVRTTNGRRCDANSVEGTIQDLNIDDDPNV